MIYEKIRYVYDNTLRPILPRKAIKLNGYKAKAAKPLDRTSERDMYEQELIEAIRQTVTDGEIVTVIGGGWGISSIVAEEEGAKRVTTYEACSDQVQLIQETLDLNNSSNVTVIGASVTKTVNNTIGDDVAQETINPNELSKVDTMIIDAEGAEIEILDNLSNYPDKIVVETHGIFGCPTKEVKSLLQSKGYQVEKTGTHVKEEDVCILKAIKENN
jgi:predicted nicotinamide N-methyase